MIALSHSLAHRAHPATRPRLRWQPYSSIVPSSLSSRSSPASYLNTPVSSVSSSPPSSTLCEIERLRQSLSALPKSNKDMPPRDPQRNKRAIRLVDQAVKSLCEIWHHQDIPSVFLTSSKVTVTIPAARDPMSSSLLMSKANDCHSWNPQLPSPITPSAQPSPPCPGEVNSVGTTPSSSSSESQSRNALIPIKGFVHEVLRRSRTSGDVLQTALCYLEAIRSKVPELLRREQNGDSCESESCTRITLGDVKSEDTNMDTRPEPVVPPIGFMESDVRDALPPAPATITHPGAIPPDHGRKPKTPSPPLQPLPPLPSPLLCPRRAFLASLILASKFTQDKCYSNRAWAKLSGLPPREIGRCERALGDALEWRLWVGKPIPPPTSAAPVSGMRTVVRSHSDGDLISGSKASLGRTASLPSMGSSLPSSPALIRPKDPPISYMPIVNQGRAGLRRAATLPSLEISGRSPCAMDVQFTDPFSGPYVHVGETIQSYSFAVDPRSTITHNGACLHALGTLSGHSNSVNSVAFSPDGTRSPSLPTPTLSHSPSSTESSGGDRTIQMASFIDELTVSFGKAGCFAPILQGADAKMPSRDGVEHPESTWQQQPYIVGADFGVGHVNVDGSGCIGVDGGGGDTSVDVGMVPDIFYHHHHGHAIQPLAAEPAVTLYSF